MFNADVINIALGFVEGFALILSPCILPVLPVFLAISLTGSKTKVVGMLAGFTLFFALLIFFSRQLVDYFGINFNWVRDAGYVILLMLGVVMLSSYLTEKFARLTGYLGSLSSIFNRVNKSEAGFFKGLALGGLIAVIWTPCAGPILAAIIVQTVVQDTNALGFLTLLAFALGAVIPLFILSLYGKKIVATFAFFKKRGVLIRQFLGALIIVSVVYMAYFEQLVVKPAVTSTGIKASTALIDGLWRPYPAPQIAGITNWINSPPLSMSDLRGKVVLVDFWTYSCINCLRTLPYIKGWYNEYHDKGLVIIGIHTPEFDFEKDFSNVKAAVARYGILYPVALDNQFKTWVNFENHYWPAHYLINKNGDVVYTHFGEGSYDVTENNIRYLLGIDELAKLKTSNELPAYTQTPETYLGYERADSNLSPALVEDQLFNYSFPATLPLNGWGLRGMWQVNADSIAAIGANAALRIHFNARKVFMVMGNNSGKPIAVKVLLNNKEIKTIIVSQYSLYELVAQEHFKSGQLEIITQPGVVIYTLTFGN